MSCSRPMSGYPHHVRRLPRTPLVLAAVLALTTLGLLGLASPAGAAAVCAFDPTTGIVTVTLAASEAATISRMADAIALDGVACGTATVTTTDTIQVTGTGPSDEVTIDLSGGAFAPGLTTETDGGDSEIEFVVDLGSGTPIGAVHLLGGAGSDAITIGDAGVNLNAAEAVGDADVTFTNPVTLDVDGGAGDDTLSAAGGGGTGAALAGVTLHGGDGDDVLSGASGGDVLMGDAGTDTVDYSGATQSVSLDLGLGTATVGGGTPDQLTTIENANGSPGDDQMIGDAGPNVLSGGDGNDVLDGSAGDDRLDGGAGTDTADYSAAPQGLILNLAGGKAIGDGTDILLSIDNVIGSAFDDDMVGDAGANILLGGDGNDVLDGAEGDDTLDGGPGNDTADFGSSTTGVTVDLKAGTATGAGADTLTSIENATGTDKADNIQGSDGPNTLDGRGGPDVIHGRAGRDVISGGSGNDFLVGGDGGDTITGGRGRDQLDGGKGHDTCKGGPDPDSWTGCES